MTNDEAIAATERELEETKVKAQEKIDAQIAKVQARLNELKAKAEERETAQLVKLNEQIAAARVRVDKAQAHLMELEEKRAELVSSEQPALPADVNA
jgi:uncharacterized coiled-coil protein SlyX